MSDEQESIRVLNERISGVCQDVSEMKGKIETNSQALASLQASAACTERGLSAHMESHKSSLVIYGLFVGIILSLIGLLVKFGVGITGGVSIYPMGGDGMEFLLNGLVGAGFGLATAITGILKNKNTTEYQGIDKEKMITTIIISGIAGFVVGNSGMSLTDGSIASAIAGLAAVGLTEYISNLGKAFLRYVKK